MFWSKNHRIAQAIYEDNLAMSGKRRRPVNQGKRIVASRYQRPPLILFGSLVVLALVYSAVSVSRDETTTVSLDLASQTGKLESVRVLDIRAPEKLPFEIGPGKRQTDRLAEEKVASLTNIAALPKVAVEDGLDEFFYETDQAEQALEAVIEPDAYSTLASAGRPLAKLFGLGVRTIVIDPGHGGKDPGAIGHGGTFEKDIALAIGKQLRNRLERQDNFTVYMTREKDEKVSLSERVAFAKDRQADLFISIHINSFPLDNVNFIETYYFGPNNDSKVMYLAEKENADSEFVYGEFKEMIQKIGDTMKYQESKQLATAIQHSLYTNLSKINTKASNHGIKPGPFVVLLGLDVPSILTEVTSLSDKLEEQRLNTTEYRDKIAKYLEKGIVSYLNKETLNQDFQQNATISKNTLLSKNTILSGGGGNAEKEEDSGQEKTRN